MHLCQKTDRHRSGCPTGIMPRIHPVRQGALWFPCLDVTLSIKCCCPDRVMGNLFHITAGTIMLPPNHETSKPARGRHRPVYPIISEAVTILYSETTLMVFLPADLNSKKYAKAISSFLVSSVLNNFFCTKKPASSLFLRRFPFNPQEVSSYPF